MLVLAMMACLHAAPAGPAADRASLDWEAPNRWVHVGTVTAEGAPLFEGARARWLTALRDHGGLYDGLGGEVTGYVSVTVKDCCKKTAGQKAVVIKNGEKCVTVTAGVEGGIGIGGGPSPVTAKLATAGATVSCAMCNRVRRFILIWMVISILDSVQVMHRLTPVFLNMSTLLDQTPPLMGSRSITCVCAWVITWQRKSEQRPTLAKSMW